MKLLILLLMCMACSEPAGPAHSPAARAAASRSSRPASLEWQPTHLESAQPASPDLELPSVQLHTGQSLASPG